MQALLDSLADEVQTDTFTHVVTSGDTLQLVNLLARFRPDETRRILFLTHWDTRPRSDNAADPALRAVPVPGANDGASGTAVLLELARLLAGAAPPMGVDLLFVDGEDYGPSNEDMFLGSRRYANRVDERTRPIYAILLDMVGDADASFPAEVYSAELAPIVLRRVLQTTERLGYQAAFPPTGGQRIYDDHVPLNQAGIPTVDIIDFSYGPGNTWWHTPDDTPERLSAATLGMVGEVVAELIYSGG
jgi:Zn-dependent M28 family amino/carboxypeptidase